MQRLNMIQGFQPLAEAAGAVFHQRLDNAENARLVKFRILTEQDVILKVSECDFDPDTGEVSNERDTRLLTVVKAGFDEIEFFYRGSFVLNVLGGDIWLDTFDNAIVSTEPSDLTNYARLWEREERDPRILEIERAARHNQMALLAQMQEDFARHAAAMEARYAAQSTAQAPAANGSVGGSGGGEVPTGAPADDPAATGTPAGGAGGQSDGNA